MTTMTTTVPTIGLGAWVRSLPAAASAILRGEIHHVDDHLGTHLAMSDGRTFVPFRNTISTAPRPGARASRPAVLQARFRLEPLPAHRHRLHALFRVVCIATTPFFVGLPGFRSKLWMVDPWTGEFAGLYQWDSEEAAAGYERGLVRILQRLSTPGSVSSELVPDTTVDEYLRFGAAVAAVESIGHVAVA
jgi:hypothetical protein